MNAPTIAKIHDQSMDQMYRNNYRNVYYQVLSFVKTRDTALDLTHDIFLKAMEQFEGFRGQSSISTWLYAIAKNHCLEYLRKSKYHFSEITASENQAAAEEYDLEEETARENRNQWIEQLLNDTGDPGNNILYLKHKMNYSVRQIQDHLNLSESAVKMRLQRARKRIATSYADSEYAA